MSRYLLALLLTIGMVSTSGAIDKPPLVGMDVFELRYASSPLISPDGKWIVFCKAENYMLCRGANHMPYNANP